MCDIWYWKVPTLQHLPAIIPSIGTCAIRIRVIVMRKREYTANTSSFKYCTIYNIHIHIMMFYNIYKLNTYIIILLQSLDNNK